MSHFTTVETKITDIVCLKKALQDLNFAFTEAAAHQKVHVKGYANQKTEADMVIHISKTYDVGVKITEKGVKFVADWWGVETTRGVTEQDFIKQITQRYSYHKVIQEITKKGYSYVEEKEEDEIHIKVTSWQ